MNGRVGASIVSIITESLYDKPIVVFREYIQNAVDSLSSVSANISASKLGVHVWHDKNSLYFVDNGRGIVLEDFLIKMTSIANSDKSKVENIGYKGIGRLSGISYCEVLSFINILDFKNNKYQQYDISARKYSEIRRLQNFNSLTFDKLMDEIGSINDSVDATDIRNIALKHGNLFENRNTGFIVILKNISPVLQNVIKDSKFLENLNWLLPIPFADSIASEEPFVTLANQATSSISPLIPAKAYNIFFNGEQLYRPLSKDMIRTYLCTCELDQYGICLHSFSNQKIVINKTNSFSGIRIYIDNMMLCDESELIPALIQYGLTSHTSNELLQSVRGIGALIYIVDKVNISTNARRTFIDVTDEESISFLRYISEFIEKVYRTRYALSEYAAAKENGETNSQKINFHRDKAIKALEDLASEQVTIDDTPVIPTDFDSLSLTEQKAIVKKEISKSFNASIKKYLTQINKFNLETCFDDFKTWLKANK